jgi:hypothetical protein
LGVDTLPRPLASTLFIPGPLTILAQADFKEYQEQSSAEASRHKGDGEYLAGQSADQGSAHRTSDNEYGGRRKRQDARARGHGPKVQSERTAARPRFVDG